jgi:hypothetical protein
MLYTSSTHGLSEKKLRDFTNDKHTPCPHRNRATTKAQSSHCTDPIFTIDLLNPACEHIQKQLKTTKNNRFHQTYSTRPNFSISSPFPADLPSKHITQSLIKIHIISPTRIPSDGQLRSQRIFACLPTPCACGIILFIIPGMRLAQLRRLRVR